MSVRAAPPEPRGSKEADDSIDQMLGSGWPRPRSMSATSFTDITDSLQNDILRSGPIKFRRLLARERALPLELSGCVRECRDRVDWKQDDLLERSGAGRPTSEHDAQWFSRGRRYDSATLSHATRARLVRCSDLLERRWQATMSSNTAIRYSIDGGEEFQLCLDSQYWEARAYEPADSPRRWLIHEQASWRSFLQGAD